MNLTDKETKSLAIACERHRLYLLAKNDYNRFEALIGKDKAREMLADLKKTRKLDGDLCFDTIGSGPVGEKILNLIRSDIKLYIESKAGKSALSRMKLHILWAALSHFVLLAVAICLCILPWINHPAPINTDSPALPVICYQSMAIFLLTIWIASMLKSINNLRDITTSIPGAVSLYLRSNKAKLYIIAAPLLLFGFIQYLGDISLSDTDSIFYRNVSLSVVAFAHIALILDCLAGLSPRRYYFCMEGFIDWVKNWFKGIFSPDYAFSASLNNCYNDRFSNVEEHYREGEQSALNGTMEKSWIWFGNRYGQLEFHPSSSLKFITAYVLVDILHTSCIIAWMLALIMIFLPKLSVGESLVVATVSLALLYVILNHPLYTTNRFHSCICRNLYAYKVSHLFRKLFYSAILIGGIAGLSYIS